MSTTGRREGGCTEHWSLAAFMLSLPIFPFMLIALGVSYAQAHPARHRLPVSQTPAPQPHLVVAEGDGGFVIHGAIVRASQSMQISLPNIPLGDSVRLDPRLLLSSSTKEIPDGETR